MESKKVILFIVEGPTDENALEPILKEIFKDKNIVFHIVYGDVTSDFNVNRKDIVKEINQHVLKEMKKYGYRRSDILKIVQLIDTDGAYVPDDSVSYKDIDNIEYTEEHILCCNPANIKLRNELKANNTQKLCSKGMINRMPYSVLYFSRNMEHVLHNNINCLTEDDKVRLADIFADKYTKQPDKFIEFIEGSEIAVNGEYEDTWAFIMQGNNSLKRYSNLHLLFTDYGNVDL